MQNPHDISAHYIRQTDRYNTTPRAPQPGVRQGFPPLILWVYGTMIGVGFGLALFMAAAPVTP